MITDNLLKIRKGEASEYSFAGFYYAESSKNIYLERNTIKNIAYLSTALFTVKTAISFIDLNSEYKSIYSIMGGVYYLSSVTPTAYLANLVIDKIYST